MLRSRLLSALILISCALVFVGLDAWAPNFNCPGIWLLPLGFYLIFGSAYECTVMVKNSPTGSITVPGLASCLAVMLSACVPMLWSLGGAAYPVDHPLGNWGWPMAAAALGLMGSFVWYFSCFEARSRQFERAVLSGWLACYFGFGFSFILAVRTLGRPDWGLYLLVGIILVTKFADSGAYFAGRSFGRTKLSPRVSPNKTVEGLVGGVLAACLAAWIYFGLCGPLLFGQDEVRVGYQGVLLLGGGLTLAGLGGDLMQSMFKREMGCKDSGKLLPGMGGLWDVTDSILPSVVVGYLITAGGWLVGPGR